MLEILEEKCIGCGQCVKECFPQCLSIQNGKVKTNGPCMECGHCFAVCPTKAIKVKEYPIEDVLEFNNSKPEINSETLLNFIKSRRSIRNYKDKKISKETLKQILEAGRFTPTGGNLQDVEYIFIQENLDKFKELVWQGLLNTVDTETIQERYRTIFKNMINNHSQDKNNDGLFFNAPALLIVTSNSNLNGGLASSNIELMANAEGLGILYSGFIQMAIANNPEAYKYLEIDPSQIKACMLIGYPDVSFKRTVQRKETSIKWL